MRARLAVIAAAALGFAVAARADDPAAGQPAVSDFARLATIAGMGLNPSGTKLLVVRQAPDGRYEVEIRATRDLAAPGLSFGAEPAELRSAVWLSDDRILVGLRERVEGPSGPGFWGEFFAVFDDRGRLVYRLPGASPQLLSLSGASRGAIYIAYDSTGDGSPDVHRLDVQSGRETRIFRGNNRRFGFAVDRDGEVRISATFDPDRFEVTTWARTKGSADWIEVARQSPSARRTWTPVGFLGDDTNELTVIANLDGDTAGLHVVDIATGRTVRTLFRHPDVDVEDVVTSVEGRLLGARYATDRPRIAWLSDADAARAAGIEARMPGRSVEFGARTGAGFRLVRASGPSDPGSYYLLDAEDRLTLLGMSHPELQTRQLADVRNGRFVARDGLAIPYYLTLPTGAAQPRPLVVMPHGGPWARDHGGWDEWAQLLAAQGYAVVQPQFRGSTGFGRAHWLAGDREWGGRMQDDLDDAVAHLVRSAVADPARVAMLGWSYGGYAALTAAWRGNGLYRCAIAGAAVSDLGRINAGLSENFVLRRIQKPTIAGPSPLDRLSDATVPVLVIHGDIDQTVPVSHGRDAAKRLKAAGKPHVYLEVGGLDHRLDRFSAAHKLTVYSAMTDFLARDCGLGAGR